MTPTRLRVCLALLFWSQRRLAVILGRAEGAARQWARGSARIPDDVAEWLEALAAHAEQNPPPRRNR